jgi:hypothetical protein
MRIPRRWTLAALVMGAAMPLSAQRAVRPQEEGLGLTFEPSVGYTVFGDLYRGGLEQFLDGSRTATGTYVSSPQSQLSFGLTAGYDFGSRSPWSLFGTVAYGNSSVESQRETTIASDRVSSDLRALQVTLGVGRTLLSSPRGHELKLLAGGNLTRLTVVDVGDAMVLENPGVLGGLTFIAPLWETVGIQLGLVDSYVHVDTDGLERRLQERAPPGIQYRLEDGRWTNVVRLSVGMKVAY